MVRVTPSSLTWPAILSLIACGSGLAPLSARAQDTNEYRNEEQPRQDNQGFQNGDFNNQNNGNIDPNLNQDANQNASQGVVRLARFAYVKGNVTWRADGNLDWSQATTNLPVRQDAQIWVTDGGRAELQFDDGSVLRLGNGALVTLKTLYSDEQGEFTQITMNEGLASLRARHDKGVYRVDTPLVSVTARGPAKVRFGIGDGVEVAVRQGQASIEGNLGKSTLESGDFLDLRNADTPYEARRVPREDNWDRWNAERDDQMEGAAARPAHRYLPSNIAIVANDLDDYGAWHDDSEYGHVWCPRVTVSDWRPYHYGHWTWVNPFGWTWVSDESWGWAPYHYGTWVERSYGWAWCPGPVNQYWSPAVVNFCETDSRVAWCPLAPREVHYPALLSIGFRSGNWSAFFSIGSAGVYYPGYNDYCVGRAFNTGYVNHVTYVNNVTNIYNNNTSVGYNRFYNSAEFYAANRNTYLQNRQYIPFNARNAAAVTMASREGFGTRTAYQALPKSGNAAIFANGRVVSAPAGNAAPLVGPSMVRPTRESLTPLHTFGGNVPPPQRTLSRTVYQAPLPATIARRAVQVTPSGTVITSGRPIGNTSGAGTLGGGTGRVFRPGSGSNASGTHPMPPSTTPGQGNGAGTNGGQNYRLPNSGQSTGRQNPGVIGGNGSGNVGSGRGNAGGGTSSDSGVSPRLSRPYTPSATGRPYTPLSTNSGGSASSRYGGSISDARTTPRGASGGSVNRGNSGNASSAEQAAAQARASLGLPTGRTSGGSTSGSGRTYGGSSSGSSERTNRDTSGQGRVYSPNSGVGTRGNSGVSSEPRNNSGATYTPRSSRTYEPPTTPRSSDSSRSSYSPGSSRPSGSGTENSRPGYDRGSGRNSEPRSYGSGTYSPPTRGNGDSTPRTYNPPARTYTPPAPSARTSAPSGRSESASRPLPPSSHDRPSDSSKDKDKKNR